MPIHVTTSTTQSLSNKTFVDRLSTTGIVYADSGNSNQWSSAYSSVYATSATWDSTYTSLNTNSAKYDSVYTSVNTNSAKYDSTYTSLNTNSAKYDSAYTTTNTKSANWDSTYNTVYTASGSWAAQTLSFDENTAILSIANNGNTVSLSALSGGGGGGGGITVETDPVFTTWAQANSGKYESTYTTVYATSATWDSAYTSLNSNSAKYDSAYTTVLTESGNWKQELSFDESNARLSISSGNFVSLSARVPEVIIRTQSFSTSLGTLANVSPLSTNVVPYEKVLIEIMGVKETNTTTEGMKISFTGPEGAQVRFFLEAWISTTGSRVTSQQTSFGGTVIDASGNTTPFPFRVTLMATMGANGGPIQFQVASELSPPTGALVISDLMVMRVHRIP